MAKRNVRSLGLLLAALAFSALAALGQGASSNADPSDWLERDKWQHPQEVMNELRLRAGSQVADVGCGEGYFTFRMADRVGPQGRVYAEDIQPGLIRGLWHQSLSKWLVQVRPVLGAPDNPHLPRGRLNAILVVIAYHEMREHDAITEAFYRALRPGGRLGIIEYVAPDDLPREESYKRHRIPAHTVKEEITRHGFHFVTPQPAVTIAGADGPKQYFLLFEKPEE